MTELIDDKNQRHYCKHCNEDFLIALPLAFNGDALLECPGCHRLHSRQFEVGVSVSCEQPRSRVLMVKGRYHAI